MKIPSKIKVAGFTYKVKRVKEIPGTPRIVGQADHDSVEISVVTLNKDGKKKSKEAIEKCFIHEIFHCLNSNYNNNALNEKTIERLSHGLYQVLTDNKLF